ncbi:hypothetical protein OSB04_023871 [Centaurea solstitialis]|uniref:Integrase zinc-binding domain-containing protein n=1 Tax=Centaurea solstitialis TaxID=347529 RepID=A0AA38SLQ8_9ASTR|nr:hypothetical protein OSB04_023871 [Centaurea solstitialis]
MDLRLGICLFYSAAGNHAGGRSLANRISRQGYYWPTLREDAIRYDSSTIQTFAFCFNSLAIHAMGNGHRR